MELSKRIELIDSLLVEATHAMEELENLMMTHQMAGTESASSAPGTSYHQEPYTLRAAHAWWTKAHQGLTVVRNAFEQIEQSARQRKANT